MVKSYKITYRTHLFAFLFALFITPFLIKPINKTIESITTISILSGFISTRWFIIFYFLFIFISVILICSMHELFHGIAYMFIGCKVNFGFKYLCMYTQCTSSEPVSVRNFLIILLFPLIGISLFSLLFIHVQFMCFLGCLNILGCGGDILMAAYLLQFPLKDLVVDRDYGFDVIKNEN